MGLLEQLRRRRQKLMAELEAVERAIAAVEATGLQSEQSGGNTDNDNRMRSRPMPDGKRMLRAKRAQGTPETSRLRAAFRAAGHSMHMAVDCIQDEVKKLPPRPDGDEYSISQPYLTMAAQGKRPMWRPIADIIAQRYGYAATPENWPDLRDES